MTSFGKNTFPSIELKTSIEFSPDNTFTSRLCEKKHYTLDVTAEEFNSELEHSPNVMYDVDGELYETDDNGTVYMADGRLLPNIEYTLNDYTYSTDAYGNIIKVDGNSSLNPDNERDIVAQGVVGGEDRRPNDQGGHLISREMNGDSGMGNLVAMDSRINQSDYKRMESDIRNGLNEGKDVSIDIDLEYDGDSERPSIITSTVTVDGEKTVYRFDNNMDGGLRECVPENGKASVEGALCMTGGEVSSIKESCDKDGDLTKTVVTITYQDENGNNRRMSVPVDPD